MKQHLTRTIVFILSLIPITILALTVIFGIVFRSDAPLPMPASAPANGNGTTQSDTAPAIGENDTAPNSAAPAIGDDDTAPNGAAPVIGDNNAVPNGTTDTGAGVSGPAQPGTGAQGPFRVTLQDDDNANQIKTSGVLKSFPPKLIGDWNIGGVTYHADQNTAFDTEGGAFKLGGCVQVKIDTNNGGKRVSKIETEGMCG